MKTFEIQYISRYEEQKEYYSEIIKSVTEDEALKKFAKMFKIKDYKKILDPNFMWEDGEGFWLANFKCINEVHEIVCPKCHGSGRIKIE